MKIKGIFYASLASSLWGISGIAGEKLFKEYHFSSSWLVSFRTLIAGILLLTFAKFIKKKSIFEPFENKKDLFSLIIFGVFGMYMVQYTYFKTIQLGNVSFATIMQFTAPFYIFIFECLKNRKFPSFFTIILLLMTALGVIFIATKGNFSSLSISPQALILGIISAIMIAFYSIYPKNLLKKYGSLTVVGWGMIFASFIANIFHQVWNVEGKININSLIQVFIVVIIGTTFSYFIYVSSLSYISSSLAGVLTVFEPVVATILAVIIFGLSLTIIEIIAFLMIFVSIFLLERRL